MAVEGAEEPTTPPAVAISSAPHGSPILHTATPIGYRQSTSPSPDPALVDVTVQLCPLVISLVWTGLQLPMLPPVAYLNYYESSERKEERWWAGSREKPLFDTEKSVATTFFGKPSGLQVWTVSNQEGIGNSLSGDAG